ncbi:MAG: ABC transporter ATP-binding protein [Planctomycetota bacterium]
MTTVTTNEAKSVEAPSNLALRGGPDRTTPIWLDRVSKWYGSVIGVNEMSLRVESGIVGLLGPNGAGKSTLIRLITGQLRPNLGKLRVYGRSVRSPSARRRVGYCPDVDAFYEEMSGREFVDSMLRLSGYSRAEAKARAEEALETVGMSDELGQKRGSKKLRSCSKGMRQRIKLAQAIAHDPDLLVLDEPMAGLDPVGRRDFCRLFRDLADRGKTILISSHILNEIEDIAESVILIGQGRILAQGTWGEVVRFLDHLPQQVHVTCDRLREFVSKLILWPGVIDARMKNDRECVLMTRDPDGLCERIGRLVCEEGFRVDRLRTNDQWADALFSLAEGG